MKYFQVPLAAAFWALQASAPMAEDLVVMSMPIGWGDISDFELCKVIIDTGGIDCGTVKIPTTSGPREINYYTAWGPKSTLEGLVQNGSKNSPAKWSDELASLFDGVTGSVNVSANGCAAVLIPDGCSCKDSDLGLPIVHCEGSVWESLGMTIPGGEIPWPILMRDFGAPGTISSINGPLIPASRDSFEQFRFEGAGN